MDDLRRIRMFVSGDEVGALGRIIQKLGGTEDILEVISSFQKQAKEIAEDEESTFEVMVYYTLASKLGLEVIRESVEGLVKDSEGMKNTTGAEQNELVTDVYTVLAMWMILDGVGMVKAEVIDETDYDLLVEMRDHINPHIDDYIVFCMVDSEAIFQAQINEDIENLGLYEDLANAVQGCFDGLFSRELVPSIICSVGYMSEEGGRVTKEGMYDYFSIFVSEKIENFLIDLIPQEDMVLDYMKIVSMLLNYRKSLIMRIIDSIYDESVKFIDKVSKVVNEVVIFDDFLDE